MRYAFILLLLMTAVPAAACEKCSMWYDSQSLEWCKECVYSYCGYFQCAIEEYSDGTEMCGSAWDADGNDQCYTEEGVRKNWCGPEDKDPIGEVVEPQEWRFVRARVLPRSVA
jgi:hypothetical protein